MLNNASALSRGKLVSRHIAAFPSNLILKHKVRSRVGQVKHVRCKLHILASRLTTLMRLHLRRAYHIGRVINSNRYLYNLSTRRTPHAISLIMPLMHRSNDSLIATRTHCNFRGTTLPFIPGNGVLIIANGSHRVLLISSPLNGKSTVSRLSNITNVPGNRNNFALSNAENHSTHLSRVLSSLRSMMVHHAKLMESGLRVSHLATGHINKSVTQRLSLSVVRVPFRKKEGRRPFHRPQENRGRKRSKLRQDRVQYSIHQHKHFTRVLLVRVSLIALSNERMCTTLLQGCSLSNHTNRARSTPPSPIISMLSIPSRLSILSSPRRTNIGASAK